ncbi:unnamed protein product [Blepharisma stoltei]|uniref:Uncharacterized protein n=1 Tax=Blepharisma stoltei TaxID=1481888 RepID=A0AAU9IME1_9CILI|nr:unnamed protein product [Blepharisma stoltei]
MKKVVKNILARKNHQDQPKTFTQDGYLVMESKSLHNLSSAELCEIIYKFDSEVKRLNQQLQIPQQEKSSSENEIIANQRIEALQNELRAMRKELENSQNEAKKLSEELSGKDSQGLNFSEQLEFIQFDTLQMPNPCCSNKDQEIEKLNEEIRSLKESIETIKTNPQMQELKITINMMEKEIGNQKNQIQSLSSANKGFLEKLQILNKQKQAAEMEANKGKIEIESLKKELNAMNFQKEDLVKELRNCKSNCAGKEDKLQKKCKKIKEIKEKLLVKTNECTKLESELNNEMYQNKNNLFAIKENFQKDLEKLNIEKENQNKEYQEAIKQLELSTENEIKIVKEKIIEKSKENDNQKLKISELEKLIENQNTKISSLEADEKLLKEKNLKNKTKKSALKAQISSLKDEIQREKNRSLTHPEPQFTLNLINISPKDAQALQSVSFELDSLYKHLMIMMMNGSSSLSSNPVNYSIPCQDFTAFEAKLNNLLMQIREALDSHPEEPQSSSWASKLKSSLRANLNFKQNSPVKVLTCFSPKEETKVSTIARPIAPKKIINKQGGGRTPDPTRVRNDNNAHERRNSSSSL